jgi:hypothetical protein
MVKETEIPMSLYTQIPPAPVAPHPGTGKSLQMGKKIRATFYCTLFFVLLSYQGTYKVINDIITTFSNTAFGGVNEYGAPTVKGVFVHSILFFVLAFLFIQEI